MLKLADLAARGDFEAGPLRISPARRLIEGPAGAATVEPIVMKVFLLLLDAAGSVVTRDELFGNAWGGVFVGDDSLNRAIARVRKIAAETAPGLFEIETIPRTGYRITGEIIGQLSPPRANPAPRPAISRRSIVVAGSAAAAVASVTGLGIWKTRRDDQQRFDALLQKAQDSLDYDDTSRLPMELLQQAVAIKPDSAKAQGLLAYSLATNAEYGGKARRSNAAVEAEKAAATALSNDPNDANARLARILLQHSTLDFLSTEERARAVLATSPDNIFGMRLLWNLMQSVGRSHDALALVERALAVKPMSAASNFPRAQLLWIVGRTAEADRIIDRALQYWPDHPSVRFARFTIFAFTGRAPAAAAMLDRDDLRPQNFSPESVALWRIALSALADPSKANVDKARVALVEGAERDLRHCRQAILCLPALGQVDAAFDVANLLFLFRNPAKASTARTSSTESTAWRFAPYLFVPSTAALRADPRFATLADGIGLTAYWEKRGVRPDYRIGEI